MSKKITFSLTPEIVAEATEGVLLGDFNNWMHEAGVKLKKQKDGSLKATIDLEPGVYQYRYFLNDGRWVNDGNAHGYSFNCEFGIENCVISIPLEEVKETVAIGELVTDIEVKPKEVAVKKVAAPKAKATEKPVPAAKKATAAKPVAAKKTAPKATAPKATAPAKKVTKKTK